MITVWLCWGAGFREQGAEFLGIGLGCAVGAHAVGQQSMILRPTTALPNLRHR